MPNLKIKAGMRRTPFKPATATGVLGQRSHQIKHKSLKSKQRAVTALEKIYWSRLASEVGCIACSLDGRFNDYVSIHHIDGRTKPGCHQNVLPLCAGHHQDGAGEDKTMAAVHPWKHEFESAYGSQADLKAKCDAFLELS